jgi:hypothetical protein
VASRVLEVTRGERGITAGEEGPRLLAGEATRA